MKSNSVADKIIRLGFYLLFILVPLILTPWNYELFEFNKMLVTYALTGVIVGAWIFKMASVNRIYVKKTPLDIPIALFVVSQFISAIFSIDPHVSWFGYYSRFNGGMWSILSYVLLYYAFVSNWSNWTHLINLIKTMLITAVLIAFYGFLERLGIDKHLWVQDVQTRVFSTLGQPNWLAAYLVALIPLTWGMGLLTFNLLKTVHKDKFSIFNFQFSNIFYFLMSILFFTVLLFTRSRSGLVGLAIADIVFWGLLIIKNLNTQFKNIILKTFIIIHLIFLVIVTVNGTNIERVDKYLKVQNLITNITQNKASNSPAVNTATQAIPSGTLLEFGGTESGTIRKYVWQAALTAWKSTVKTMLIGTGTETFAWTFFQYRPVGHNLTSEWDFLYNKAHNEYLNYLATTGVLGLGSYILLIGIFILMSAKKFLISNYLISKKNIDKISQLDELDIRSIDFVSVGLFSGWISILVTNFFGFSVVIIQLFLFLFPAMFYVLSKIEEKSDNQDFYEIYKFNNPIIIYFLKLIAPAVSLGIIIYVGIYWRADTLYAGGYRQNNSGNAESAILLLQSAGNLLPNEPMYQSELGSALSVTAVNLSQTDASTAALFAQKAISHSDQALTISPNNVNFWKTRTKILYSFSGTDKELGQAALKALYQGWKLSPNDPKIIYNLSVLESQVGDMDKAVKLMLQARDIKPNYKDAYFGLYTYYNQLNKPDLAKAELEKYLSRVDPGDAEFNKLLK